MFDWLVELLYECWQRSQYRLVIEPRSCPWLVVDRSFGEWLADVDRVGAINGCDPYIHFTKQLPSGNYWHSLYDREDLYEYPESNHNGS